MTAPCWDCGVETVREFTADWYMVRDEIWRRARVPEGFLCLECLSHRIGRPLKISDFKPVPVSLSAVAHIVAIQMSDALTCRRVSGELVYRYSERRDALLRQFRAFADEVADAIERVREPPPAACRQHRGEDR